MEQDLGHHGGVVTPRENQSNAPLQHCEGFTQSTALIGCEEFSSPKEQRCSGTAAQGTVVTIPEGV